jgi:hypothetical protein
MLVDNDVPNGVPTLNNFYWSVEFCGIVVAILKMATRRNCSMSGINSGHHNLPTYEMALKSDNVFKMTTTIPHKFNIAQFQRHFTCG